MADRWVDCHLLGHLLAWLIDSMIMVEDRLKSLLIKPADLSVDRSVGWLIAWV